MLCHFNNMSMFSNDTVVLKPSTNFFYQGHLFMTAIFVSMMKGFMGSVYFLIVSFNKKINQPEFALNEIILYYNIIENILL